MTTKKTTLETVYDVLPDGTADQWTTARAVAEFTGLDVSTVRKQLKRLGAEGRAESTTSGDGDRTPLWRQTFPAEAALAEADPYGDDTVTPAEAVLAAEGDADGSDPETVTPLPAAADEPASGDLGDVAGWMEGVRPVSPAPVGEPAENSTGKRGRRGTEPGPPREPGDRATPVARGTLGRAAITYLREHPDEDFGPVQVTKAIGARSSGAVANALERLATTGEATRTNARPARYRAA